MKTEIEQKQLATEIAKVASKIVPELVELTKGTEFSLTLLDDGEGFGMIINVSNVPQMVSIIIPELLKKEKLKRKPIEAEDIDASTMRIDEGEKVLIMRALEITNGNRIEAAERLGFSERHLNRKMKEYGLKK